MTAAFLASASDASQELLVKEAALRSDGVGLSSGHAGTHDSEAPSADYSCDTTANCSTNNANNAGFADASAQADCVRGQFAAGDVSGRGFVEARLDSPPLFFYSDIRLPSPPLWPGEDECSYGKDGTMPTIRSEVEEDGDDRDICPWGLGADRGNDNATEGAQDGDQDMLSLVYDPILMCYYERTSGRYFQLKEGVASDPFA